LLVLKNCILLKQSYQHCELKSCCSFLVMVCMLLISLLLLLLLFSRDHELFPFFFFFCLGPSNVFQSQCRASVRETNSPDPPPLICSPLPHHHPLFVFVWQWCACALRVTVVVVVAVSPVCFCVCFIILSGCCCWRSRPLLRTFFSVRMNKNKTAK